jgi:hypothetical protein
MSEEQFEGVDAVEGEGQEQASRLSLGLTPFGHIGINITESNGTSAGYVIQNADEASQTVMHLLALTVMMIQTMYARVMAERAQVQQLLEKPDLWTPPS